MVLAEMARRHERLGRHTVEMRAFVGDETVSAAGLRRVAVVGDDGMGRDPRHEPQPIEPHQDRRLPLKLVDAGGQALAEDVSEEARAVFQQEAARARPVKDREGGRAAIQGGPGRPDPRGFLDAAWR